MPICCSVMKSEMTGDDEILDEPKGGEGASLLIRYKLPRQSVVAEPAQSPTPSSADAPAHSNPEWTFFGFTAKAIRNLGIMGFLGWLISPKNPKK